ncbi:MAG: restriction endonuclease subunit S [Akkermansiaceae bacterium]|jgi:type I restriction enzyme S subunit
MELKPGYKQTEVGVIPKDWRLSTIGSVSTIFGRIGFRGYTKNDIVKEGQGAIALNPSNVRQNKLVLDKCTYITWQKYHESPEIKIDVGDVILVKTGSTTGKTCYVSHLPIEATLNPQMVVFKKAQANRRLLSYIFATPIFLDQIAATIVGGALPTLSQKQVASYRIPLPPTLAEQEAIAGALSDADALIDSLEQLIAKKRLLKQGAMQDLLTGKKRLPGFEGEWEETRMGTVLTFQAGFPFGSAFFNQDGQGLRLVRNRDLKGNGEITSYSGDYSQSFVVDDGDVLVGMDGEFVPCLWKKGKALLNQRIGRIVPKEGLDPVFTFYRLAEPLREIENTTAGTTVKHLSHRDVEEIRMPLPKKPEQTAIAAILSDMDVENAALEAKLAKARQVKQGMMQELLTGKTRLV